MPAERFELYRPYAVHDPANLLYRTDVDVMIVSVESRFDDYAAGPTTDEFDRMVDSKTWVKVADSAEYLRQMRHETRLALRAAANARDCVDA